MIQKCGRWPYSWGMDVFELTVLGEKHLKAAQQFPSGRSSVTLYGDRDLTLRQTLIALLAGQTLHNHSSPGEATLQVIKGRASLRNQDAHQLLKSGDYAIIPHEVHSLHAHEDTVLLLTASVELWGA